MTEQPWQPLSARYGGTPIVETWQEGVPAWIRLPVRQWLFEQLSEDKVRNRLYARLHYHTLSNNDWIGVTDILSDNQLLDWVDAALHINRSERVHRTAYNYASSLDTLLCEGHSVWKVSERIDGLERRQDGTVTNAAHRATETARSTGRPASAAHLEAAWTATYGLHADPSKAFGEAVLAVEAVAVPEIVPRQADATLGHVLGQLTRQAHLYEMAIADKTGALS